VNQGCVRCHHPYHEITLDEIHLIGQSLLGCVLGGTLNLIVVVVEASDVGTGELGNLSSRATDTAANVEDLHALLNAHAMSEVVFVSGNSLIERLALREATEVEGLAPAILVQVGCEVVVTEGSR
jgi:hypothetical protein